MGTPKPSDLVDLTQHALKGHKAGSSSLTYASSLISIDSVILHTNQIIQMS